MLNTKKQTCCFTGHRNLTADEYQIISCRLEKAIVCLIKKGVCYFGSGAALGFDILSAQAVLKLKSEYPQIKLILVLPCREQTNKWKQEDIDIYNDIKSKCDKFVYTSEHYYRGCMFKRNRHLVDNSGYCICYMNKNIGGTAYTVNYAKERGLQIYNIADYSI